MIGVHGSGEFLGGSGKELEQHLRCARYDAFKSVLKNRPCPYRSIDAAIAHIVERRWPRPCESAFEYLASHHPLELAKLISSEDLRDEDLTFAAEMMGTVSDAATVKKALIRLLKHPNPVVREGAIYGLSAHLPDTDIEREFHTLALEDGNKVIRDLAASYG